MSTPWPGLGMLLADGYEEQPDAAVLRTDVEAGPAKQRPTANLEAFSRSPAYRMSQDEYVQFLTWRRGNSNGAVWFDWTDPRDGVLKTVRMVGGKFTARPAQFTDGAPLEWVVKFEVETLE